MLLNQQDVSLRYFLFIEELTAKSGFWFRIDVKDILSVGGGLLNYPALFVLTLIHLF